MVNTEPFTDRTGQDSMSCKSAQKLVNVVDMSPLTKVNGELLSFHSFEDTHSSGWKLQRPPHSPSEYVGH